MENSCPCGSGAEYQFCCARFINGPQWPASPEQLMRSRYSAFVKHNVDYLVETWHPDCQALRWRKEISAGFTSTRWRGLRIVNVTDGRNQQEGYVEFIALFDDVQSQRPGFIHERSRFVRLSDRWYYSDGAHLRPARNAPCPCGSGKKNKNCCGQ